MADSPDSPRTPAPKQPIRRAPQQSVGCAGLSMPFVAMLALVALIGITALVLIGRNPQAFVASVLVERVGMMTVPDEQKQHMVTVIYEVRDRLAAEEITHEQARNIGKELGQAYDLNAALFYYVADRVQRHPEYTGRDPEAMTRQLQRLVRGVVEGKIDGNTINELAPLISDRGRPKQAVPAADLERLEQQARALADEAGVPDEPYDVDAGALFEAAVRRALSETESSTPGVP